MSTLLRESLASQMHFSQIFFSKLSGLGLSYTPCQCFIYEDCLFSALE